jgi:hypothetical protein
VAIINTRKVLLLELNEITRTVIDPMLAAGKLPHFARLLREGASGAPMALERYPHLDPWVTWVTLHTGVERHVHGAAVLEQEQSTIGAPCTWDHAVAAGKSVGVFGSIGSFPPRPVPGFMVPGPFAPSDQTFPAYLSPIQALNRSHTRAHNKVEGESSLATIIKQGADLFRFGLRPQTCARIVRQLLSERLQPHLRWRRPSLQPLANYDFFAHLYRKFRPDYATWHTNHAAHYMHHYWRAHDDRGFLTPSTPDERKKFGTAVEHGYRLCDELIGRFLTLVGPDTVLVVASSMGQKPYVKQDFPEGRFIVRFRDIHRILEIVGARGVSEVVAVMAPQFRVTIRDQGERSRVADLCRRAVRRGPGTAGGAMSVIEVGDLLTITPTGLDADRDTAQLRCHFDGAPDARSDGHAFEELFVIDAPTPKQGMHDPRGLLILHGPGIRPGLELGDVTPLDIAPTILALLGVPQPSAMTGRVLREAWDSSRSVPAAA